LAHAAADDDTLFAAGEPLDDAIARLRAVKGVGEWTAHYIALRALRHPDAFPASDVGLLRGAARETGTRPTPAALRRRAECWRPYRAYAAQLLWAEDGDR
jgi:AraC family transcriptional regulator of adaptative response / DNA-3-methyladenine glycosylase II